MTRQEIAERNAKLRETMQGAALLDLLERYPSRKELQSALGLSANAISQSILRGQVSRQMARAAEERLGIPKEKLRPDLSPDDWALGDPGKKAGEEVVRDGHDQQTLLMLADHFGGVRAFADKAGITVADYHRWMSRNRIADHAIPRLRKLRTNPEIKARLAA